MTVVAESFVLNVTGLLDWTLKHIEKCRLRHKKYIPSDICTFKLIRKTLKESVKYIQS